MSGIREKLGQKRTTEAELQKENSELQRALDAARAEISDLKSKMNHPRYVATLDIVLADYKKQLADAQAELKLCKDGWATVSSNYLDAQDKLELAKAQIADYESALEFYADRNSWTLVDPENCSAMIGCDDHDTITSERDSKFTAGLVARETLNKWRAK